MPKFKPDSRAMYDPQERLPTANEKEILSYFEKSLSITLEQLETVKRTNRFGTAYHLQVQAITLRNVIDSIRAGYHDEQHPYRVISQHERALLMFGQI